MGCLLSKGSFRHDEVSPISIRPIYINAEAAATINGKTLKPAHQVAQPVETTFLPQAVLSSDSVTSGSSNQNGGISPTSQENVESGHVEESVRRKVDSERDAAVLNGKTHHLANGGDAITSLHQSDAGQLSEARDTDILLGHSTASGATSESAGDSGSKKSNTADLSQENSATGPANENDATQTANQNAEPAAVSMPEVIIDKVPDGEGCPITLGNLFGVWTAPWPSLPEQIMRAQLFTFHDTDVVLVGYPKSGSHWLWEMVHMLMKGRAEHCRTPKERLMFSFSTQEFFDSLPPPRVFNTHAPFPGFPAALREGTNRCKMIYLLRNPKDVAVSFYHQLINQMDFDYEGTFHGYLDLFLEGKVPGGSWFDYVLGWEQTMQQHPHLPILVLHYEDVKEDTVDALQRVNEFLGLGRDPQFLTLIADQCTIGKMKEVDEELKEKGPQFVNLSKTGQNFMLRKGEVGDWQNWFSSQDDQRFMQVVHDRLRHSQLRFRYLLGGEGNLLGGDGYLLGGEEMEEGQQDSTRL